MSNNKALFLIKARIFERLTASALPVSLIVFLLLLGGAGEASVKGGGEDAPSEKGSASDTGRFVDNGDGTVLDKNTGYIWLKDANIIKLPLSLQAAKKYVQQMNAGEQTNFGFTNWRMPTINELETLVDKGRLYPSLPAGHPFENVQNHFYWSSSLGADIIDFIWIMDMASGNKSFDFLSFCNYRYLWPVRSSWVQRGTQSGAVFTSGLNDHGQLGDGTTSDRVAFKTVKGISDALKVAAGREHAAAIISDSTVWTWGRNIEGQLGNGTNEDSLYPALVKGLWNVIDVSAGMYHTVALKSDGTVWAWGRNTYGQMGDGTYQDSTVPVQVKGLTDVVKVATGMYHTVAVKSDGTAWAWGWNIYGQLGDGTKQNRNAPVQVKGISKIDGLSAGLHHTVAVRTDGTVWAWGWNTYGLLGDGTKEDRSAPVQVKNLSGVIEVSAGLHHTVALRSDGTVWAWGVNEHGQLGTSTTVKVSAPIMVEGINNVQKISAGMYHSVAMASDGTVWVWGKDLKDKVEKSLPTKIRDVSGAIDIVAGKYYTVVIGRSAEN